jgi:hypothetical protein
MTLTLEERFRRGFEAGQKKARGARKNQQKLKDASQFNGRAAAGSRDGKAELRTTCAAALKPKALAWLVPGMLPLGKLVLLAGHGGLGKSAISIDLAARLSRGESAFGLNYPAISGGTLVITCEDDREDTILPRLLAAGAALQHIHFLDGVSPEENGRPAPWSLAHHDALDAHLAANPEVRLVILDPASAFAGLAGIDGHKDSELRALLGPLTDVAAHRNATFLFVAHLGKSETARAVSRVLGSVAWVNAVRSAWIVAEREEDGDKRLLLPIKANLSPGRCGLAYRLIPLSAPEQDLALAGIDLPAEDSDRLKKQLFRVAWLGETDASADQVFAAAARRPELPSDVKRAGDWLRERLRDGPVESERCVREGNNALSMSKPLKWWRDSILKGELQGKPQKNGFNGGWAWALRDSWDSSSETSEKRGIPDAPAGAIRDSSSETSEKRGIPAWTPWPAVGEIMQKAREITEESEESRLSPDSSSKATPKVREKNEESGERDSSAKTSGKRGIPAWTPWPAVGETSGKHREITEESLLPDSSRKIMQKTRGIDEESQESEESTRSLGWIAPDADPAALRTPFDERQPGEEG